MKIVMVAGARPNFMKIAPVWEAMKKYPDNFQPVIVHTGQHYDIEMSGLFLGIGTSISKRRRRAPPPNGGVPPRAGKRAVIFSRIKYSRA